MPRPRFLAVAVIAGTVLACSGDGTPESSSPTAAADVSASPIGAASTVPAPTTMPSPTPSPTPTPTPTPTPSPTPSPTLDPLQGVEFETVADGLTQPVDVAVRPDDGTLHVVEQAGAVLAVTDDGGVADEPFLDVSDRMEIHSVEQGLLGMAFHPDFPEDPRVFVFHSRPDNDNVLASYAVGQDTQRVDPDTRTELLVVDKEPDKIRHNGGQVAFGPDGLLYVSTGDGARASVNGQDPSTLLGAILRIDVDSGDPYAIPADNPFADGATLGDGVTGAPEVFWFGLRNPWRFAIDAESGMAWIGDVGQETAEEINLVPYDEPGVNFGWPSREGTGGFYDDPPVTEPVAPVLEISHDDEDDACSLTGGVVHRGPAIPELDGTYFYADWCNGWIRSVVRDGREVVDAQDWSDQLEADQVSAFAHDADGEVLVVDWKAGTVERIVPVR